MRSGHLTRRIAIAFVALPWLFSFCGCSHLTPGVFTHPGDRIGAPIAGHGVPISGVGSPEVYHKVREAEARNSVVLEIVGDDEPLRVLPLPPPGEQSVFVSDLLTQTGVLKKLDRVDAVLYRNSPGAIGGVKMDVKMTSQKDSVRPESDYALRPGDRLQVAKAPSPTLDQMLTGALGL